MKIVATKIPEIVKEAKYNKKNYEELNALKKDKIKKIDSTKNKREANLLRSIQMNKKLDLKVNHHIFILILDPRV
jgi:hypothetical protein